MIVLRGMAAEPTPVSPPGSSPVPNPPSALWWITSGLFAWWGYKSKRPLMFWGLGVGGLALTAGQQFGLVDLMPKHTPSYMEKSRKAGSWLP